MAKGGKSQKNQLSALERKERKEKLIKKLSLLYYEDTIFIRLNSTDDLFNCFDPAPEQQRELSGEVEAYILRELEYKSPKARIAVTFIADDLSLYDIEIMRAAFANHFTRRAEEQLLRNRKSLKSWFFKLCLGIAVLGIFLFGAHFMRLHAQGHPFFNVLGEGLGIVGWVALWEPAAYFLYGHNEERQTLFNLLRLRHATVTIRS